MQCLWKKLLIILFLNSIFFGQLQAIEINNINTIYRDKKNITLEDQILPNEIHIKSIIEFINTWDSKKPIVIHCWCGVSRSMATAVYLMCSKDLLNIDRNIKYIRKIAAHADPNKLMISIFENFLNVGNKISNAFKKYPHTIRYDCETNFAPVTIFDINDMKNFK